MKKVKYTTTNGKEIEIAYDENAPCIICGEPVISASMAGTDICPWCDLGKCRYCGIEIMVLREEIDGGRSKRELREHMKWHKNEIRRWSKLSEIK